MGISGFRMDRVWLSEPHEYILTALEYQFLLLLTRGDARYIRAAELLIPDRYPNQEIYTRRPLTNGLQMYSVPAQN